MNIPVVPETLFVVIPFFVIVNALTPPIYESISPDGIFVAKLLPLNPIYEVLLKEIPVLEIWVPVTL